MYIMEAPATNACILLTLYNLNISTVIVAICTAYTNSKKFLQFDSELGEGLISVIQILLLYNLLLTNILVVNSTRFE